MPSFLDNFSVGLFFWTTLLFLALFFLLRKFAWKPILEAINQREANIEDALNRAKKAREEMAELTAENDRIIKEAKAQRDLILREAKEMKDNIVSEAKESAKIEAEKVMENARKSIENEKMAALTEIKNQVANLSIGIAEKVVGSELSTKEQQEKLVNQFIKESNIN